MVRLLIHCLHVTEIDKFFGLHFALPVNKADFKD